MKSTSLLLFLTISVAYATETCPNFPPWREWNESCLWLPLKDLHENMVKACDIRMSKLPPFPELEGMPSAPCGHCSIKTRCKTRELKDGCFPIEMEKQICHEHSDVCTFPKIEMHNLGCNYGVIKTYFGQCQARHDIPEWKREGYKSLNNILGDMNCIETGDGQCKCCCHPFKPSADGQTCKEQTPPQCEDFGEWNDWSSCLWIPLDQIQKDISNHCAFDGWKPSDKHRALFAKLKLPGGVERPAQCGYCSAKMKCRKRPFEDANGKKRCFPIEMEKKSCGQEDCPTCADVCTLPKVLDSCNYSETLHKVIGPKVKAVLKKLPYSMTHGLTKIMGILPHTECIEKEGECKCCCHPYKPNEEGTECILNTLCKSPEEQGIKIEFNASEKEDDAFWFL